MTTFENLCKVFRKLGEVHSENALQFHWSKAQDGDFISPNFQIFTKQLWKLQNTYCRQFEDGDFINDG